MVRFGPAWVPGGCGARRVLRGSDAFEHGPRARPGVHADHVLTRLCRACDDERFHGPERIRAEALIVTTAVAGPVNGRAPGRALRADADRALVENEAKLKIEERNGPRTGVRGMVDHSGNGAISCVTHNFSGRNPGIVKLLNKQLEASAHQIPSWKESHRPRRSANSRRREAEGDARRSIRTAGSPRTLSRPDRIEPDRESGASGFRFRSDQNRTGSAGAAVGTVR